MRQNENAGFIPALTGIRAVAVYFIFFKHLNPFESDHDSVWYLLVNQFYCFLDFFFVLSGFLIFYKYRQIRNFDKVALRNYFVNRFARVFPILILLVTITFAGNIRHHPEEAGSLIKLWFLNISLLKGFSSDYLLTGIGPSWTLSVEELFYFLSPLIFFIAVNYKRLFFLVISIYLTGFLLTWVFIHYPLAGIFSSYNFTFNSTFFGRFFEFACGIGLGMFYFKQGPHRVPGSKSVHAFSLFVILLSLALLWLISVRQGAWQAIETWPGALINNLLMPAGIALFFYSLIYERTISQKILGSKIMVRLGNATYSFYLMHTSFFLSWIFKYLTHNLLLTFLIMIGLSLAFHKWVEQPLAVLVRKKWSVVRV